MNAAANSGSPAFLCAHRGMNVKAPENTLPAFEAAVENGAEEIELDLWPAKDGTLVVCHDPTVDRTTDGCGPIAQMEYAQLRRLNAGSRFSDGFGSTPLPLFEEVLEAFGRRVTINLHIKSAGQPPVTDPGMRERMRLLGQSYKKRETLFPPLQEGVEQVLFQVEDRPVEPYPPHVFEEILRQIQAHHAMDRVYITGEKDVLLTALKLAPDLPRCCLEGHMNYSIVENALRFSCSRVQFCKLFLTRAMIDRAKANGLHCNLFWCDDPEEALAYRDLGIDTVLTNAYDQMAEGIGSLPRPLLKA